MGHVHPFCYLICGVQLVLAIEDAQFPGGVLGLFGSVSALQSPHAIQATKLKTSRRGYRLTPARPTPPAQTPPLRTPLPGPGLLPEKGESESGPN